MIIRLLYIPAITLLSSVFMCILFIMLADWRIHHHMFPEPFQSFFRDHGLVNSSDVIRLMSSIVMTHLFIGLTLLLIMVAGAVIYGVEKGFK